LTDRDMAIWVDTDFGFDDLWALLLLASQKQQPDGISLVAGNTDIEQVCRNALGAASLYNLSAPLYLGASQPLSGQIIRATEILGPTGMQQAGPGLPDRPVPDRMPEALAGLQDWLATGRGAEKICIALGPLTNLACLAERSPDLYRTLSKIVWMGGSAGRGNHSPLAEFNAMADPEAAAIIAAGPVPLQIVDLTLCRQVAIKAADIAPLCRAPAGERAEVFASLLTGYLDIARTRGREAMAIYDPLAAASYLVPDLFGFQSCNLQVERDAGAAFGKTDFLPHPSGLHLLANQVDADKVKDFCLNEIAEELGNG
jgi:inosine-uridine nucleoside N-ribohydrolase